MNGISNDTSTTKNFNNLFYTFHRRIMINEEKGESGDVTRVSFV